jgi:N-acetylglucosaminyl-diphospho-decaprenol L-rhamnosyltransferase
MAIKPIIDAVIVSYNSRATLRGCVEPLARMDGVHVVVVDNASPEDPLDTISDLDVSIVRAPRNGGFSYGCNLGAEQGSAPHVLFLNPDARIDEPSLAALRGVLEADPSVGVAGPRILDADGTLLRSQRRFPRPGSTFGQALFLHRLFPNAAFADELIHDEAAYERPGTVDWLSGACLLVRRAALADIGGMDEGFFLYCEDTDLSRRLLDAGYSTRFEPSATARHEEGSSAPRSTLLAIHARSRVRYARRHLTPAAAALDTAAIALNAATHAVVNIRRPEARGHALALRAVITGPVS